MIHNHSSETNRRISILSRIALLSRFTPFNSHFSQYPTTETIAIHQSTIPMNRDYYRCVTDSELGYLTGKDGQYGKYTMRLTSSPTDISHVSSTPPVNRPDYTARMWHPDNEMYHTCVPEQFRLVSNVGGTTTIGGDVCSAGECSSGISLPPTHTMLRRSPGGLELATVSKLT